MTPPFFGVSGKWWLRSPCWLRCEKARNVPFAGSLSSNRFVPPLLPAFLPPVSTIHARNRLPHRDPSGGASHGTTSRHRTRDPRQQQDPEFARAYAKWTTEPRYGSPLVDHLPKVAGIPSPKDVLGYYIGQPKTLTYYADAVKYYRAAAAPARAKSTINKSDAASWSSSGSSEANIRTS
jgi:hypothetical protein